MRKQLKGQEKKEKCEVYSRKNVKYIQGKMLSIFKKKC